MGGWGFRRERKENGQKLVELKDDLELEVLGRLSYRQSDKSNASVSANASGC